MAAVYDQVLDGASASTSVDAGDRRSRPLA
jgi:hypothetical protein